MDGEGQWVLKVYWFGHHESHKLPSLAQANVCKAIVVAEGYVEGAVSIEGTAIEADVLVESLEEKGPLIDGRFCFARHGG